MMLGWSSAATICDSAMKRSRNSPSLAEVGQERLQRGLAPEDAVLGLVDEAHAASTERARNAVAGDMGSGASVSLMRSSRRVWPSAPPVLC